MDSSRAGRSNVSLPSEGGCCLAAQQGSVRQPHRTARLGKLGAAFQCGTEEVCGAPILARKGICGAGRIEGVSTPLASPSGKPRPPSSEVDTWRTDQAPQLPRAAQAGQSTAGRIGVGSPQLQSGRFSTLYPSHAGESATSQRIVRQLEQYYALWTQLFFPFWASPGTLQKRFDGKATSWPRHDRLVVVLLKDRAEYLEVLGVAEDNIGISVGYYNPGAKMSFFYLAENMNATLYHELTHQLFLEATSIDARLKRVSRVVFG